MAKWSVPITAFVAKRVVVEADDFDEAYEKGWAEADSMDGPEEWEVDHENIEEVVGED